MIYFIDKRVCMAGIARGDGWIVPVNIFIETQQFVPTHCSIFENLGMFMFHVLLRQTFLTSTF